MFREKRLANNELSEIYNVIATPNFSTLVKFVDSQSCSSFARGKYPSGNEFITIQKLSEYMGC